MIFKDNVNRKTNQQNVGTIKSSNLCCEIVEHTSKEQLAVCNLCTIPLPCFVKNTQTRAPAGPGSFQSGDNFFDFTELEKVAECALKTVNRMIDVVSYQVSVNLYPETPTMSL